MTMYATLEEAIDAAREEFLADNPGIDAEDANVQQFNAQNMFCRRRHHVALSFCRRRGRR